MKEEKREIESEIEKYSSFKSHEAAELEKMAKDYDILMANKQILKNQIQETKKWDQYYFIFIYNMVFKYNNHFQ